jgi:hypothetical protein
MTSEIDMEFLRAVAEENKNLLANLKKSNQIGASRKPYYTEKWAGYVKEIIDAIKETAQPRLIPIGDMSETTIKLQWYQGKEYLLDHLDPKGEYKALDDILVASPVKKRGLIISPVQRKGVMKSVVVQPWRPRLEEFLEVAQPLEKFERVGLGLAEEDVLWLKSLFTGLDDMFVWDVDLDHDVLLVIRKN